MGFTAHVCTVEVKLSVEAYWKNSEAPLLKQGHFSFPKSTLPLSLFIVLKPDHLKKSLTNIAQLCSLCPLWHCLSPHSKKYCQQYKLIGLIPKYFFCHLIHVSKLPPVAWWQTCHFLSHILYHRIHVFIGTTDQIIEFHSISIACHRIRVQILNSLFSVLRALHPLVWLSWGMPQNTNLAIFYHCSKGGDSNPW